MLRIFKGFELAEAINAQTRTLVETLARPPRCVVLMDVANAGMSAYVRRQQTSAEALGIAIEPEAYSAEAAGVLERLRELAAEGDVDAVATLYPLPPGVDARGAALVLGAARDVDGLHPMNAGDLALGAATRPPATAMACLLIAEALAGSLKGREVVLVGASRIVGRPLANLLLDCEATVTVTHAATRDLAAHTRSADIVITAAGVPGLIGAGHLRDGATVLDVSINRVGDGLVGDVDLASLAGRAMTVTHVPDGVGPVTTACLMRNITEAALQAS